VVDGATWNGTTAINGIETFLWSQTITTGTTIALVPATNVPADGVCGTPPATSTTPTIGLCTVGTPTLIVDNGVYSTYTWACSWVNGGNATASNSCSTSHTPVSCMFDTGNFDQCTFAP
jgi:hypothetical protein